MKTKNAQKNSVGYSMRRLRRALEPLSAAKTAEEIAFHLAELKPELSQLIDLLNKIEKQQSITPSAMKAILYFVDVHWPYHFKELRKLVKKRRITQFVELGRMRKVLLPTKGREHPSRQQAK